MRCGAVLDPVVHETKLASCYYFAMCPRAQGARFSFSATLHNNYPTSLAAPFISIATCCVRASGTAKRPQARQLALGLCTSAFPVLPKTASGGV